MKHSDLLTFLFEHAASVEVEVAVEEQEDSSITWHFEKGTIPYLTFNYLKQKFKTRSWSQNVKGISSSSGTADISYTGKITYKPKGKYYWKQVYNEYEYNLNKNRYKEKSTKRYNVNIPEAEFKIEPSVTNYVLNSTNPCGEILINKFSGTPIVFSEQSSQPSQYISVGTTKMHMQNITIINTGRETFEFDMNTENSVDKVYRATKQCAEKISELRNKRKEYMEAADEVGVGLPKSVLQQMDKEEADIAEILETLGKVNTFAT